MQLFSSELRDELHKRTIHVAETLQKLLFFSFQAVLNQKFTDCFVLVFLDAQAGKTVSL